MTEQQGAFTVSTKLLLSDQQRARLEQQIFAQRIDLAELVSMIVAERSAALPQVAHDRPLYSPIPTRLFLTPEDRQRIEDVLEQQDVDLAALVSQVVTEYLDAVPDPIAAPVVSPDSFEQLRQRRAELRRLRASRSAQGVHAPAWLSAYIAELAAEIARLEEQG